MKEGIAPCGGPLGASIAKGSRRKAATWRAAMQERTQECMTEVMAEGIAPGRGSEDPQMPRARGARQQPRRIATQERTQECMTAVMNEGTAPCGGPGGASIAKGSRRKAANPEGRDSRADSRMHDCGHEGRHCALWRSRRSLNRQGLAAQGSNPGGPRFKSGLKNA